MRAINEGASLCFIDLPSETSEKPACFKCGIVFDYSAISLQERLDLTENQLNFYMSSIDNVFQSLKSGNALPSIYEKFKCDYEGHFRLKVSEFVDLACDTVDIKRQEYYV